MNSEIIDVLNRVGLKLLALRQRGVRFGCIMSPQEVVLDVNEILTAKLAISDNAWSICGDVSAEMFSALRTEKGAAVRAIVFGEGKQLYFVVIHQVKWMQHRFILPLYEPLVQEFLAHAVNGPVWFSFGDDGRDSAVVLRSFDHQRDFIPVLALAPKWDPEDRVGALANLLDATQKLSRVEFIPSCLHDWEVTQLSITIVAPRTAGEIAGDNTTQTEDFKCMH